MVYGPPVFVFASHPEENLRLFFLFSNLQCDFDFFAAFSRGFFLQYLLRVYTAYRGGSFSCVSLFPALDFLSCPVDLKAQSISPLRRLFTMYRLGGLVFFFLRVVLFSSPTSLVFFTADYLEGLHSRFVSWFPPCFRLTIPVHLTRFFEKRCPPQVVIRAFPRPRLPCRRSKPPPLFTTTFWHPSIPFLSAVSLMFRSL